MGAVEAMLRLGVLTVLAATYAAASDTIKCAYDMKSGDRYTLAPLIRGNTDPYRVYRGQTSFSFNVCDPVGMCGANLPSAACKTTSIGGMETAIGSVKGAHVHALTAADVAYINQQTLHQPYYTMENGGQGVKMVYPAMQNYGAAGVRDEAVTIMIPCDSTAKYPIPLRYIDGAKYETAADGFMFVLPSIHGCPTNKPIPQMGDDPMSFGWVFIIFLAVSCVMYCLAGIAYKMYKFGVRGIEAVPHIDFWRELPHLVKDGIWYSSRRVRECGDSGVPERYSSVVQGNAYDTVL